MTLFLQYKKKKRNPLHQNFRVIAVETFPYGNAVSISYVQNFRKINSCRNRKSILKISYEWDNPNICLQRQDAMPD